MRRRWTSSARGTLTTASVEALVGTAQITATVAPNGRSSTSAPAAPLSDSESPSLASIFIPADGRGAVGGLQARQRRDGQLGHRQLRVGAVDAQALGEKIERLRRRLGDHAAHHAGDVGEDARVEAQQRLARAEADADAGELLEIDRAAARDERAGRLVDVTQGAPLIGGRGRQRIDQSQHVGARPVRPPRRGIPSTDTVGCLPSATSNRIDSSADIRLTAAWASGGRAPLSQAATRAPAAKTAAAARVRRSANGRDMSVEPGTQHYNFYGGNSPIHAGAVL